VRWNFVERRPLPVEPVEQLRMDRIGGGEPPLVVALGATDGELRPLAAVQVAEGLDHGVALGSPVGGQVVEEPAPDDLEAFLGRCRPP
jgi:hypothetical protein